MLSGYKVYCTKETEGCEWTGELGALENHLNLDPAKEKLLEGCQFAKVACLYCSGSYLRSAIHAHQNKQCPRRPFSCEYCKSFDSTHQDVTTNHWQECGYYPLQCPLGCGELIKRRSYQNHISNKCILKCVECEFGQVGCDAKLPRRDMLAHLNNSLGYHMTLLLRNQSKLQEENEKLKAKCATLEAEKGKQAIEYKQLSEKYKELALKQNNYEKSTTQFVNQSSSTQADFTSKIETLTQEIKKLKLAQEQSKSTLQRLGTPVHSVDFKMSSFDYYRKYNKSWTSPPFYTHPYGYKLCLGVDANGWGIGTGKIFVAVHVYLMKGEHDSELRWPLVCDICVELLNQESQGDGGGQRNIANVISFQEMSSYGTRVMTGDRALSGPGKLEFVSHSDLQPKYLKSGGLIFRIKKIEFKF